MRTRKIICYICFLLILALCGCGKGETSDPAERSPSPDPMALTPAPVRDDAPGATPEPTPAPRPVTDFTAAESEAMSRYMCANRWLLLDDTMVGLDYDQAYRPVLASYRLRDGQPTDFLILADNCLPEYLSEQDGVLYFLCEGRVESLTMENHARRVLLEGPCSSLQLFDNALYYTDDSGRFCRAELDGSGQTVLIKAPCAYAYVMHDALVYQAEEDGECLYLRRRGETTDQKLTGAASYAPVRIGDTLWYSQKDPEGSVLSSVSLSDGTVTRYPGCEIRGAAEFFLQDGEWVVRATMPGKRPIQQLFPLGSIESGQGQVLDADSYRLCDYTGEGRRIDAVYEADGRLHHFSLVGPEGEELAFLAGKLLDNHL